MEKLHLEAARIVTGLPIFTSSEIIYKEIGWEKLEVRRNQRKLQMLHSIFYNRAPDYLTNLLAPSIQSTTIYPLRNGDDLIVPFCRMFLVAVGNSFQLRIVVAVGNSNFVLSKDNTKLE